MIELYTSVVEKALLVLDETEENITSHRLDPPSVLQDARNAEQRMPWNRPGPRPTKSHNVWPPWPFPTWGEPEQPERENKTARTKRLAKEVVHLEQRIAEAGADLSVTRAT